MDFFRKCDIYVYIYWKILNGKLHFLCSGRLLAINYFRKKNFIKDVWQALKHAFG